MSKVDAHFVEDTQRSRCSKCHKQGHNRRKCPEVLREQVSNAFVCLVVIRVLLLVFLLMFCYLLLYLFFSQASKVFLFKFCYLFSYQCFIIFVIITNALSLVNMQDGPVPPT